MTDDELRAGGAAAADAAPPVSPAVAERVRAVVRRHRRERAELERRPA